MYKNNKRLKNEYKRKSLDLEQVERERKNAKEHNFEDNFSSKTHYNDFNENNLNNEYDHEYQYHDNLKRKGKKRSSGLYKLNLILSLVYITFIFILNIFYIRTRLIFTLLTILIQILLYLVDRDRNKISLRKFISKIYMLINILFVIGFILFYFVSMIGLIGLNKDDVPVERPTNKSFNIMILGSDNEGDIENLSRTDVNLLLTINLKTREMITTTIPRDSYFRIQDKGNNEFDKLTHAGNYGAKASVLTIENAFNIPVDYYFRVNFTSFKNIVDSIGGITVNNKQRFISNVSGIEYKEGLINLDGNGALDFVRERYGLQNGDIDRGLNQSLVINAIAKKLLSPSTLIKYPKIIKTFENSSASNLPLNTIISTMTEFALGRGFDSSEQTLQGTSKRGLSSYQMPGYNLYMYVPDEESIREISENINRLLDK